MAVQTGATEEWTVFAQVAGVVETERGLEAAIQGERFAVDLVRPDVVRLRMSRDGVFDEQPSHALCVDPLAGTPGAALDFRVEREDDRVLLVTAAMTVTLGLMPFRVDIHRADGSAVIETAADPEGRYWTYATHEGRWTLRRGSAAYDNIYGLGEKGGGHDRKGRDFTLWNTDVLNPHATAQFRAGREPGDPRADMTSIDFDPYYVSIPFFYHRSSSTGAMAGSFVDNTYQGHYDFSREDDHRITFDGGQWTEYVFAGPSMPAILEAYTWLTGRAALPPIWALGYHQCRWHAYTQDDVERIGQRYRDDEFPCDALWLDIEYMDGYRVFTWDEERFPDHVGMLERLSAKGFRVITIIDPGVKREPGYWVFDEGLDRDVFCRTPEGQTYIGQVWPGETAFPDFATAEAREWWGELNAAHLAGGPAGIWNDMNEPATGEVDPGTMLFERGAVEHGRYHNEYALLMAMGTHEGLMAARPDQRTFVLSRAGSAGIQRYAANWMGDNQARWDHLWVSITMGCGMGVSGQAFVGSDIGGFQGDSSAELFLRWMQYGALTPFCRNHSEIGNVEQYPWAFGEEVHRLAREAVRLRYRLLPYLYTAFVCASESGEPVQRPLVFDFQADADAARIDDQYLLGRDLLVAPVTEPGMEARDVYLPAGHWYDWYSDEVHEGGRWVTVETPLDRIPLFARAGAAIPMWPSAPTSTDGHHPEVVELHVFAPAAEGLWESRLVEDDGLTHASLEGARLDTTVLVERAAGETAVLATTTGRGYPEHRRTRFEVITHGGERALGLEG